MQKSDFQFTNPALTRMDFQINHDFSGSSENVDLNIKINVNVKSDPYNKERDANTAIVEVNVNIGAKDGNAPFWIDASEEARFKWNPDAFNSDQVQVLLNQNAAALLISYLRPVISNVTALSPYDRFDLPFINLT